MTMTVENPVNALGLRDGPHWGSFEDLRLKPAENLGSIKSGTVGTVRVKNRCYKMPTEEDYRKVEQVEEALIQLSLIRKQLEVMFDVVEYAHEADENNKAVAMIERAVEAARGTIGNFTRHYPLFTSVRAG